MKGAARAMLFLRLRFAALAPETSDQNQLQPGANQLPEQHRRLPGCDATKVAGP